MPLHSPATDSSSSGENLFQRLKKYRAVIGVVSAALALLALHESDKLTPTAVEVGNTLFPENPDMRVRTLSECIVARLVTAHEQKGPQDAETELAGHTAECIFILGYEGTIGEPRVAQAANNAYQDYIDMDIISSDG